MLRFSNVATSAAVEGSDHQFWAWLEKNLNVSTFILLGPSTSRAGYHVPLIPLLLARCTRARFTVLVSCSGLSLQFTHGPSFAPQGQLVAKLSCGLFYCWRLFC